MQCIDLDKFTVASQAGLKYEQVTIMEVEVKDEVYLAIWNAAILTDELNVIVITLISTELGENFKEGKVNLQISSLPSSFPCL